MADVTRNAAMRSVLAVTLAAAMCPAVPAAAAADEIGGGSSSEALALTSDASGTPIVSWTKCGTCRWMVGSEGCLVISPAEGAQSGELASWDHDSVPWQSYRAQIRSVDVVGAVKAHTLLSAFEDMKNLTKADLSGLDTSNVTDMNLAFGGCSSLTSLNLAGWDTTNVTSLNSVFSGCSSLTSLDLSDWDTSNVTIMFSTFSGCSSLTSLDLSGWDTSNVTVMYFMFSGCSSLRTVALGGRFAFADGPASLEPVLPTPSGEGLTGKWISSADGKAYSPDEIPDFVAATYTAERKFPDVDYSEGSWYADGVTFCAEKGLITGYTSGEDAGKFGVGRTLTRAQLAAILWRNAEPEAAEAYDGNAANATGMGDVADGQWYTGAANWAVKNEVINGFGGVEFRPDAPVTAEQLATILANYADRAGAEGADLSVLSGFADSDAISDWARGSVAWAKAKDIINGYDEGDARYLKPYEEIARERVATILMNAFESGVLK